MKNSESREYPSQQEIFKVGDFVVFNTELSNTEQLGSYKVNIAKELMSKYGKGPFRIKFVREETQEMTKSKGHPQALVLELPNGSSQPCSGYWVKKYTQGEQI